MCSLIAGCSQAPDPNGSPAETKSYNGSARVESPAIGAVEYHVACFQGFRSVSVRADSPNDSILLTIQVKDEKDGFAEGEVGPVLLSTGGTRLALSDTSIVSVSSDGLRGSVTAEGLGRDEPGSEQRVHSTVTWACQT
jgi:hypothetical protein